MRMVISLLSLSCFLFATFLILPFANSGTLHQICFNPGHCCKKNVIELCDRARASIDIVMYRFTDRDIYVSISNALERGISVTLIIDEEGIRDEKASSFGLLRDLIAKGCLVYTSKKKRTIHHKFAVFDRKALFTGSYNWTYQGSRNYEDCLLVNDYPVVEEYNKYIQTMFSRGELVQLSED